MGWKPRGKTTLGTYVLRGGASAQVRIKGTTKWKPVKFKQPKVIKPTKIQGGHLYAEFNGYEIRLHYKKDFVRPVKNWNGSKPPWTPT